MAMLTPIGDKLDRLQRAQSSDKYVAELRVGRFDWPRDLSKFARRLHKVFKV
jgi:hypothetical protein